MDVAITGSHGLIGSALRRSLESEGHRVRPVVRSAGDEAGAVRWDPAGGTIDAAALEGVDAVVHLAGEGIASRPWTAAQKRRIHDSRSEGTALLAGALAGLERPPSVLVSGSAMGIYGDRGDEVLTEDAAPGDDFLAHVCIDWEAAASPAVDAGIRTAFLRTSIVLSRKGGALGAQLPAFKLGLGGKAGRGDQWMSWITLDDQVRAIRHAIDHPEVSGPVNAAAGAVTNAEFTDALGRTLRRPTVLTIPWAVRHLPLGLGDLAGSLLFTSARLEPAVLARTGFTFTRTDVEDGLRSVLGPR